MLRLLGRRKSEEERRDELLSAYLDGELGERERQQLEARLAQDATLRAELRALHRTVSLMQELPQATAPRNFILSESMVERQQPARRAAPVRAGSGQALGRAWAAPLLTAATAVVSLLFVVVLAGDLLLPGIGGLASEPRWSEQSKEVPQVALEAAPTNGGVTAEREVAPSPTMAPAIEAPREEPEMAVEEEEEAVEGMGADEAPSETGTPSTPTGGGGPTEEAAALAAPTAEPTVAPTVVSREVLTPTIPLKAPPVAGESAEGKLGELAPTPGPIEVTPSFMEAEERELEEPSRGRLPWEMFEIGLGLATAALAFTTILAWRARRR
jgi:hypothetical protein